jgi:molybdopterin-guanine dinucleotide biosynthesis protein A
MDPDRALMPFLGIPIRSELFLHGQGSLVGIYSPLLTATKPFVAMAGCAMPFANPALFEYERDMMAAGDVIPSTSNGLESLHDVYRNETCLPVLQAELEAGERKIIAWFPTVKVHILPDAMAAKCNPNQLTFWNLNTPEDFHLAETKARSKERLYK